MPRNRFLPNVHPVVSSLGVLLRHLRIVKSRLPFLFAVKDEGDKMVASGGSLKNDAALTVFRDCFDMLVIDLNSIRVQAIINFKKLHQHRNILRRVRLNDVDPSLDDGFREETVHFLNERFDALFPDGAPNTNKDRLDGMIQRFRDATLPTARDRNWTRAHRFGAVTESAKKAFQTLEQVQAQVAVFEDFLGKVFVAVTGAVYDMESVAYSWDWKSTARDLADLIVLGGINEATVQYGVVPNDRDMTNRYWARRKQFFDQGGRVSD